MNQNERFTTGQKLTMGYIKDILDAKYPDNVVVRVNDMDTDEEFRKGMRLADGGNISLDITYLDCNGYERRIYSGTLAYCRARYSEIELSAARHAYKHIMCSLSALGYWKKLDGEIK